MISSLNVIFLLVLILLFINPRFCQRPCWTPKTKRNAPCLWGISFRFRCLTRLEMSKKVLRTRETRHIMSHFSTSRIELRKKRNQTPWKEEAFDFVWYSTTPPVYPCDHYHSYGFLLYLPNIIFLMVLVVPTISVCFCQRPSWRGYLLTYLFCKRLWRIWTLFIIVIF